QTLRELVRPLSGSLYAGGHTHLQLVRRFDSALLVNPGSVGVALAADAPSSTPLRVAHYALVTVADGVDAVTRPVEVDASAAAARAQASGMPCGNEWADILARRVTRSNERARARALAGARPTGEDARR
ncbi:MAG: metallophosphatase family protein, partial [Gemmatimonadota bacterium]|nr:metallophosphatase family protein [Gemmatimonadota bacterium]